MEIERLSKDKVMRPSLIDSVDKINEVIDAINLFDPTEIDAIENRVDTLETNGILTRTTTGEADGALISVTAKGHAEQDGTPTPSDPKEIVVVRGHEVAGKTGRYVDLVVTANGTTTTPIPLPSRGWVGSLPDGTHDALSIDGAGKVTWECATEEVVLDGSESWTISAAHNTYHIDKFDGKSLNSIVGVPRYPSYHMLVSHFINARNKAGIEYLATGDAWLGNSAYSASTNYFVLKPSDTITSVNDFKTWLQSNPVTVLYPLATTTTESMGYVDLPDIPDGAVVSMPELEGLGVESWNNDVIYRYVNALVTRAIQ